MKNKTAGKGYDRMNQRELTCIGCPLGCAVTVLLENGEIISVTGNTCRRGELYAREEVTHPTRIVTGTVRVIGADAPVISVKTAAAIPKKKIMAAAAAFQEVTVYAPLHIGDVVIENVAGTGAAVVVTKEIAALRQGEMPGRKGGSQ